MLHDITIIIIVNKLSGDKRGHRWRWRWSGIHLDSTEPIRVETGARQRLHTRRLLWSLLLLLLLLQNDIARDRQTVRRTHLLLGSPDPLWISYSTSGLISPYLIRILFSFHVSILYSCCWAMFFSVPFSKQEWSNLFFFLTTRLVDNIFCTNQHSNSTYRWAWPTLLSFDCDTNRDWFEVIQRTRSFTLLLLYCINYCSHSRLLPLLMSIMTFFILFIVLQIIR